MAIHCNAFVLFSSTVMANPPVAMETGGGVRHLGYHSGRAILDTIQAVVAMVTVPVAMVTGLVAMETGVSCTT